MRPAPLRQRRTAAITFARRVIVGSSVLEFASAEPLARPVVAALFHAADASADAPSFSYRVDRTGNGWHGIAPSQPIFGPASLEDTFAFLEWRATEDVLGAGTDVFLHAAGIHMGGRNVLLVGESGAGKSSLTAQLLAGGYLAWGDDLVRFAPEKGHFSAVPRSWKLDAKTLDSIYLLSLLTSERAQGTLLARSVFYVSPAAFRRQWQAPRGRADVVVLLDQARHGGMARVERMSEGEGALRTARMLLGGGVNRSEGSGLMLQVVDALSGVSAYRAAGGPPHALARQLAAVLAA